MPLAAPLQQLVRSKEAYWEHQEQQRLAICRVNQGCTVGLSTHYLINIVISADRALSASWSIRLYVQTNERCIGTDVLAASQVCE